MSVCLDLKPKTSLLKYSEDEVKKILEQYGRKVDVLEEDILTIRKWLKNQKHFPYKMSDRQIFAFLLRNKFSFEAAKEKIDMMFTIRSLIPEFYQFSLNSPELRKATEAFCLCALPNLTKNLNRVNICKYLDSTKFDGLVPIYSLMIQIMEIRHDYDICSSDEYIIDLQNVSTRMITLISPMDIKKMITVVEKVFSNRIAALHIINLPSYAESVIGIMKKFLKPKLRERVLIHTNANKLSDYYPLDLLPREYGGNGPVFDDLIIEWRKFMLDHSDYMENMMRARVDENLRPMKLDNDEVLGFHGNFRKLDLD